MQIDQCAQEEEKEEEKSKSTPVQRILANLIVRSNRDIPQHVYSDRQVFAGAVLRSPTNHQRTALAFW